MSPWFHQKSPGKRPTPQAGAGAELAPQKSPPERSALPTAPASAHSPPSPSPPSYYSSSCSTCSSTTSLVPAPSTRGMESTRSRLVPEEPGQMLLLHENLSSQLYGTRGVSKVKCTIASLLIMTVCIQVFIIILKVFLLVLFLITSTK